MSKKLNRFLSLFSWTLIHKSVSLISSVVDYIKDYVLISETLYSDEFREVIRKYVNLNIRKDWIGRLYGVINPIIDINGHLNLNNTILEFDGDNTNNDEQVKHFIYKQMTLISDLFKINRLYDYISCDIKRIDKYDNFLVVFDITSRKVMSHTFKKWFTQSVVYAIIAGVILFIIL